ncbi:MAG: metallophosphoesterase family protein [Isosphaeraceae bacterium]
MDEPFDVCLCLGDLVDYGPEPQPCVRWAMDHATYAVRGNHDHGVAQRIPVTGDLGFRYLAVPPPRCGTRSMQTSGDT